MGTKACFILGDGSVREVLSFKRSDGHDGFWIVNFGAGFYFPVSTTAVIVDFLEHRVDKFVPVGLTYYFLECVGIILLKRRKKLIDRVGEYDSVVNGVHDGFAFSQKT